MSVSKLPTGLSITQAKKDAKRLANELNIPLSHALNQVAYKHGRSDWSTLANQLNTQHNLSALLRQGSDSTYKMDFSGNKSLVVITGQPGSGKSLLMLEFATQFLQNQIPVTYLGADRSEMYHAGRATRHLESKYADLFKAIPIDSIIDKFSIDELKLNGSVLMIDEAIYLLDDSSIGNLINTSMHTFLSFQVLNDAEKVLSKVSNEFGDELKFIALPNRYTHSYDHIPFISEASQLERIHNQYTELLWLTGEDSKKLRFDLADHSAFK